MTDINNEQLERYQIYLKLIHERMLNKYFEEQSPYLCCKKGCAHCCQKGQYPMSEIEVKFILSKMASLEKSLQENILYNIQSVIKEKQTSKLHKQIAERRFFLSMSFFNK